MVIRTVVGMNTGQKMKSLSNRRESILSNYMQIIILGKLIEGYQNTIFQDLYQVISLI